MVARYASTVSDVRHGVTDALHRVINGIPQIVEAILVLIVGIIIAAIAKAIVVRIFRGLSSLKLKPWTDRVGLGRVFETRIDLATLLGDLVKWFFVVVFLLQALSVAHLQQVSDIVRQLLGYVPNVLAAAAVVFVGAVIADLTSRVVKDAAQVLGGGTASLLSALTRYSIWAVVIFTALAQLGVNTTFLDRLFTAIVVMLALAGGLAFGLGGRDLARDTLDNMRKSLNVKK